MARKYLTASGAWDAIMLLGFMAQLLTPMSAVQAPLPTAHHHALVLAGQEDEDDKDNTDKVDVDANKHGKKKRKLEQEPTKKQKKRATPKKKIVLDEFINKVDLSRVEGVGVARAWQDGAAITGPDARFGAGHWPAVVLTPPQNEVDFDHSKHVLVNAFKVQKVEGKPGHYEAKDDGEGVLPANLFLPYAEDMDTKGISEIEFRAIKMLKERVDDYQGEEEAVATLVALPHAQV